MVPYLQIPEWPIVSADALALGWPERDIAIQPFGAMVVLAIAVGVWLSLRHSRTLQVSSRRTIELAYYVVGGGFFVGHLVHVTLYAPELIRAEPGILLALPEGQSSIGGFLGAALGALLYRARNPLAAASAVEAIASSFPAAWVFGRLGCALVHDHPGMRSDAWFAVAFPAGGRLDLGLIEATLVLPLAIAFLWLRRRRRRPGFFIGAMCLYYAPLRFALDFLRATDLLASDRRYYSLTPAQWGTLVLIAVGLHFLMRRGGAAAASVSATTEPRAPSDAYLGAGLAGLVGNMGASEQVAASVGAEKRQPKSRAT